MTVTAIWMLSGFAQASNGAHPALGPGNPAADVPVVVARTECTVAEGSADYIIVNDDVDARVSNVEAILRAERLRRERRTGLVDFVKRLRDEA